ncbi:MAG: cadmium-translocating P-type ATPase [Rhizobiales bacterium]|nr:cadmium-translocating P-type ATPase [Hyphomicrobiales bacterium]
MYCCPLPDAEASARTPWLKGDEAAPWVTDAGPGLKQIEFIVPQANCAACISSIEGRLGRIAGVTKARVNLTARRVAVVWREGSQEPQAFLDCLASLGYAARPFDPRETGFSHDDAEGRRLLRALAVAGFAAANVMLFSVSIWSGTDPQTRDLFHWISALIALPAVVYAGGPFFTSAANALRHGRVNMDVPISLGVILASAMSLFETMHGREHAFFDAAVTLLFFLLIGRYLDHMMRARARSAVSQLMTLMASGATIVEPDGSRRFVANRGLEPGMLMAVAAGDRFAADGCIETGSSDVDRSIVTGESAPEPVNRGDEVQAGTLNLTGPLLVRITKAGGDTFLSELIRLMAAAEQGQSHYVRLADRLARYYSPVVHILAALTLIGWLALGHGWHDALMAAIAVLIITCPCALGLAIPAVQVVASGALFRRGVLLKNGAALEKIAEIDTVVFDKTGTLTLGSPVMVGPPAVSSDNLALAAGLARESRHPLSRALVAAAAERGIAPSVPVSVTEHPGFGLAATWRGQRVRLGSRAWCGVAEPADDRGLLEIVLRIGDGTPVVFTFEDSMRPAARPTIASLRRQGLAVEVLSGDRAAAVGRAASELGIATVYSRMSPQAKLAHVEELAAAGKRALVVGDGVNDAPALAAGFVSMAPATASDVGRTAADVVFMGQSLAPVSWLRSVGVAAQAIARQNILLALGYNLLAVPIAMLGLVTPLIAALAMSSSSIIVVANALRLGWRMNAMPDADGKADHRETAAGAAGAVQRAA